MSCPSHRVHDKQAGCDVRERDMRGQSMLPPAILVRNHEVAEMLLQVCV